VCALFLSRMQGKALPGVAVCLLLGVVALERLALSGLAWETSDASGMVQLWSTATHTAVVVFVFGFAYAENWVLLLSALVVLGGVPAMPPGFSWAMFPLALMTFLLRPVQSNTNGRGWIWVCVFGWVGLSVLRSPCGFEAGQFLSQIALVYVGYWLALGQTARRKSLVWLAASLVGPLIVGWGLYAAETGSLSIPRVPWSVNTNVLGIQLGLGSLLLLHVVRWRFSKLAWGILGIAAIGLFFLESYWALVCLILAAGATALPKGRLRSAGIAVLLMLPVITILIVLIPVPVSWLPGSILVSFLARQFDWKNAILGAGHNPLGLGIGLVHPMVLGRVDPSPVLASVPGDMMQYTHHLLLHIVEQVGIPGAIVIAALMFVWGKQFIHYEPRSREAAAGAGLLYLWSHFSADISATGTPFLVASGALFALSWPGSMRHAKHGVCVFLRIGLVAVYGYVWIVGMLSFGAWMNLSSGNLDKAESLAVTCNSLWPDNSAALEVLEELGPRSSRGDQALCDVRCPSAGPNGVRLAAKFLSEGRIEPAESLLVSVCALDPRCVIPGCGARARVLLAMIARERGDQARADSMMAGLFWKESAKEEALGRVDYWFLTGEYTLAEECARSYAQRTVDDPELKRLLTGKIRSLSRNGPESGRSPSGDQRLDLLVTEIEGLLQRGRIGQAEAKLHAAESWLREDWQAASLESKVALAKGDIDRAIALASRAVALSGGAGAARWTLVEMLSYGQRREDAIRQADILVREAPQNGGAWLMKGETLLNDGKANEALKALSTALELGADSISCTILRARCLRMNGRVDKAKALLVALARAKPNEGWPAWELASWAESEGRLREALKWARRSLRRTPGHAASKVLMGRVLRKLGRYREARQQLMAVVRDESAAHGWRVDAEKELDIIKEMMIGEAG
jgi:tetratricopeptide (TPR) repeat protein